MTEERREEIGDDIDLLKNVQEELSEWAGAEYMEWLRDRSKESYMSFDIRIEHFRLAKECFESAIDHLQAARRVDERKHLWELESRTLRADAGQELQYMCEDFPGVSVYKYTEYEPVTDGDIGGWIRYSYCVTTIDGFKKEFETLEEARAFVENGGLGHVNKEGEE